MARTDKKKTNDPHGLVPWVKEVLRLRRENGLALQPDSPSRRAGWGLILNAVGAQLSNLLHHPGELDGVVAGLVCNNVGLKPTVPSMVATRPEYGICCAFSACSPNRIVEQNRHKVQSEHNADLRGPGWDKLASGERRPTDRRVWWACVRYATSSHSSAYSASYHSPRSQSASNSNSCRLRRFLFASVVAGAMYSWSA